MSPFLSLAMAVTDLGESSVLITTAIAASGWFWMRRQRHLAFLWLFAVGGCAAAMLALKLSFLTCGHYVLAGTVHTPSGHSAMSALFYGAAALTLAKLSPHAARHPLLLQIVALAVPLAIGISRVVVHAHTPQEVMVGLAVGFAWLALFAKALGAVAPSAAEPPASALVLLGLLYTGLLAVTMAGRHMTVEGLLFRIAYHIHHHWNVCTG